MIKLTGLWKNEGKKGTYFTGKLGDAKIIIFENGYKKEDKHPDYVMYLDENKKKEQRNELEQVEDMDTELPF